MHIAHLPGKAPSPGARSSGAPAAPALAAALCLASAAWAQPAAAEPYTSGYVQVAAGEAFTCALRYDGQLFCWGQNSSGQMGVGNTIDFPVPAKVTSPEQGFGRNNIVSVSASRSTACALNEAGRAFCWGENDRGQLGDGTTENRSRPVRVEGLGTGVQAISVGALHACAINRTGGAWCWGRNAIGQLGDGSTTDRLAPGPVDTSAAGFGARNIAAISSNSSHSCAITAAGRAFCWGLGSLGQLGTGDEPDFMTVPVPVATSAIGFNTRNIAAISTGLWHSCALNLNGRAFCWGDNVDGQLGNGGGMFTYPSPVYVSSAPGGFGTRNIAQIATGWRHSCALNNAGRAFCWGMNVFGQVGDDSNLNRTRPVQVERLGTGLRAIATGANHSCAIDAAGDVWCWGHNNFGQLGDGTIGDRRTPVKVVSLP